MAINKVIYGADTLLDLTEDTVTAEDVLNSKSFHTSDGVKRTGVASYPVTDVQVNGTSVMDGTVAKVEQPTADEQTAIDEFSTINGGLLSSLKVTLSPNQDLHGYEYPWVGGAGKNKLPNNLVDGTLDGITYTKQNDDGIKINGTATGRAVREIAKKAFANGSYIISKGSSNALFGITVEAYNDNTWVKVLAQSFTTDNVSFTVDNNGYNSVRVTISTESGRTANNIVFYPMIRLATDTDPTFEPYENICPISGHTEVDVDVSDGQTTQEQVTVNLGGTYYSGTLDVVSGVLTVDMASVDLGTLTWTYNNTNFVATDITGSVAKSGKTCICSCYATVNNVQYSTDIIADHSICMSTLTANRLYVHDSGYSDAATFKTAVTGQKVVYELANPTPIQLSPTTVKALVGENHLSAPLDGQEITESKYRELFTYDDIEPEAYKIARDTAVSIVETNAAYNSVKYSTGSHKVGKWVDGTDLIETTYIVNSGITFGGTYNYISLPSYYKVRDYKGFIARTTGALDGFIYGYQGMSGDDISTLDIRPSNIEFSVQSALQTNFEYVSITIQYTVDL